MSNSEDSVRQYRDAEGAEDPDEDPGEELEAMIEQADRFASDSFGTTAEEQEQGESLDQRLVADLARVEPMTVQRRERRVRADRVAVGHREMEEQQIARLGSEHKTQPVVGE